MIDTETTDRDREVEGEDDGNIPLDPFVQPPILKALFEQLSFEDLAKCRLVRKLWFEESLSTWRSKTTVKFGKEGIVSRRDDGSRRTTSLGEFIDLWEDGDWGSCPFRKFSLEFWEFKAEDVEQTRFLELVGGHITSLTLKDCSFAETDNFRRIIYQAFPKLQFLKIAGRCFVDGDDDGDDDDHVGWYEPTKEILLYKEPTFGAHGLNSLHISDCLPHSIMDMLSHFHKLENLHLQPISPGRPRFYYRNLLEAIKLVRAQDRTKLPLKNFDVELMFYLDGDLNGWTKASCIELLKLHDQLNLPLQRLQIPFYNADDEDLDTYPNLDNVIRDILQHRSSTLKYLAFPGDLQGKSLALGTGIYLKNLEVLTSLTSHSLDNFNFLLCTPNLRRLEIFGFDFNLQESNDLFSNSSQLEIGDWTLPSLTDLTFDAPLLVCNLVKLIKWMPNVERLVGLELDSVLFWAICENWRNLRELVDFGEALTDEDVRRMGLRGIVREWREWGGGEEVQMCPNVTKLKELTLFETFSSKLTSASVTEGFLKMAKLKALKLGRHTKIGKDAKAALEGRKIELTLQKWR